MKFNSLINIIRRAAVFWVLSLVLGSACVSVSIGPKDGERSKGVQFTDPPAPYKALKDAHADGAWQNAQNGNSISYFSTCNDPADAPLETVSRDLFGGLQDMKQIKRATTVYNGREALDEEVEGKVDGILTRVHAVLFKKNGCTYALSFIGVARAFEQDRSIFEHFLREFRAP